MTYHDYDPSAWLYTLAVWAGGWMEWKFYCSAASIWKLVSKRFFIEDRSPLRLDHLAGIVGSWEVGCTPEEDHHNQHHRHNPLILSPSPSPPGLWLQIEMESKKDLRTISHTGTLVLDCVVQTERVKSTRTAVLPCHLIIDIFDKIIEVKSSPFYSDLLLFRSCWPQRPLLDDFHGSNLSELKFMSLGSNWSKFL